MTFVVTKIGDEDVTMYGTLQAENVEGGMAYLLDLLVERDEIDAHADDYYWDYSAEYATPCVYVNEQIAYILTEVEEL